MKRPLILLVLLGAALLPVVAQPSSVKGRIAGFDKYPIELIISTPTGDNEMRHDTISTDNKGNYSFVFKSFKAECYLLRVVSMPTAVIHIMTQPGEKVTLDLQRPKDVNVLQVVKTKGSKNMEEYRQYNQMVMDFAQKTAAMQKEYVDSTTTATRRAEINNAYRQLIEQQNMEVKRIVSANPSNLMSAFLVSYFDNDFVTYAKLYEQVRNALIERYPTSPFVRHIDELVTKSLLPESLAPDIAMPNPQGDVLRLSDLRGKVVMVDFWASWCRPCRMENPRVVQLYNQYHDQGFEIYSVSLDNDRSAWMKAIADDGLTWSNHVSDLKGWGSSGAAAYGITAVPATVLLDEQGRVIAKGLRGEELAAKLREVFSNR